MSGIGMTGEETAALALSVVLAVIGTILVERFGTLGWVLAVCVGWVRVCRNGIREGGQASRGEVIQPARG